MSAIVTCPECRRALKVPENLLGRTVRCPDCKHAFTAEPPVPVIQVTANPPPPTAPPALPAEKALPPAEPRGRRGLHRRDDDDYDDLDDFDDLRVSRRNSSLRPDHATVILALGIASLALSLFSFLLYIVPVWIVPLGIGIVGWIMGHRDLRAMREGTMDNSNQVMALVGMILSIVGAGISACVALLSCGVLAFILVLFGIAAANDPGPQRGRRG